jgi:serine/threonine protein kinase
MNATENKIEGGELFDEGLYGCIFTPPLKCKDGTKQQLGEGSSKDVLSKLLPVDGANLEYSISSYIHKIPLWKNYFVVSESICTPAAIQKDKELYDCPVLDDYKLTELKILNMPFGGTPLNTYKFDISSIDFMNFIIHFIEAGALLNIFGLVHRDIHQGNILIDDNEVPRIIDFNLAIPINNTVTNDKLKHKYNYITAQEPPDSTLVNAVMLGYKPQMVIDNIVEKKPIVKKIRNILGLSEIEMHRELDEYYLKSKSAKTGDSAKWFQSNWRTIDSWAVGVNIVDLIAKFLLWPEFSNKLKYIKPKLFPVLRRLCSVSPLNRIDCVQALNKLNPNSFIIRKYGKAWLARVGDGNIQGI